MPACGDAHEQPSSWANVTLPLGERRAVGLNVFEHLESADNIDRLRWLVRLGRFIQHSACDTDSTHGRFEGELVGL